MGVAGGARMRTRPRPPRLDAARSRLRAGAAILCGGMAPAALMLTAVEFSMFSDMR